MSVQNHNIAVKSLVFNQQQEVLLVKRSNTDVHGPGKWEIPGGRLDPGENPFEGLKRETKEETGIEILVGRPLAVDYFTRDDGQAITMIIFECQQTAGEVKLSEEHSNFAWLPLEQARKQITSEMMIIFQQYKA